MVDFNYTSAVRKNDAKAKFLHAINETILVPEDQKVTNTPFFLVESQRRTRELCAGKTWISSKHIICKLW